MQTRIYVVRCKLEGHTTPRLVEATSASQAIRHCVGENYSAASATAKDIAEHMGNGLKVERAASNERPADVEV